MIAVSGSTSTPIFNQVEPVGNQLMAAVKGSAARLDVVTALIKTTILAIKDNPAPIKATEWLVFLERWLKSAITTNASNGGNGIKATREFSVNMRLSNHPFNVSRSSATTVCRRR
jgi:hypothetical protein